MHCSASQSSPSHNGQPRTDVLILVSSFAVVATASPADCTRGAACAVDASSEERAFEGAQAIHAAAAESRRLSDRIEADDRRSGGVDHACGLIAANAAETLAANDKQANGHQRPSFGFDDFLEVGNAEAVSLPTAQMGDARQLSI